MDRLVAGIVGAIIGAVIAVALWLLAVTVVVPDSGGFDGMSELLFMLLLLPVVLLMGVVVGAGLFVRGVDVKRPTRAPDEPPSRDQRAHGFQTLPLRALPVDEDRKDAGS